MGSILEVRDLRVAYGPRGRGAFRALDGVSFCLESEEVLGVLGESGSGKSTLATSILGLFRANTIVATGAVLFEGSDLLQAKPDELQRIRGKRISLIFQEPSMALHPTMRVGRQVQQVLAAHGMKGRSALNQKTREVLETVFMEETERIARSYPHQLSGGQRQRVLIAQAIACGPSLVIADEPTASLDPTTQMEILGVFRALRKRLGLGMIFITHNPALLAGMADRLLVLYAGRVAELGPAEEVLASPKHPYTRSLLESIPPLLDGPRDGNKKKLPSIPGDSRPSSLPGAGCPFEPRCPERMDICKTRDPQLVNVSQSHTVSCFRYENQ
ncbi:MAG: peptide ABC transporter ATP-binding protein [Acidobacteria bacterium]|nr:MAG: peptide ABC transporter ATP-binding protein [Acidobacteriota bacterium]